MELQHTVHGGRRRLVGGMWGLGGAGDQSPHLLLPTLQWHGLQQRGMIESGIGEITS